MPVDSFRRCFDAQACWHRKTEDVVVRLMLPMRDNGTEIATSFTRCAVQSEAVVKFGRRLIDVTGSQRQLPAAWQVLASWPSFWNGSDDEELQIAPCSGRLGINRDRTEFTPRHSSSGPILDNATCELTSLLQNQAAKRSEAMPPVVCWTTGDPKTLNIASHSQQKDQRCVVCHHGFMSRACWTRQPLKMS